MTLDTVPETKDVPRGKPRTNGKAAAAPEPTMRTVVPIPLEVIDIGPNVRVNVEAIDELAASIAEHGVLQPIKVRSAGKRWTVVWGQRRVLAARKAGLRMIPALTSIEEPPADKLAIEQLVENLHRADLNPIDRAAAMRTVVESGVSQADLAKRLGIAPSTVANDLGLLEAPEQIRSALERGELTPSHAKALKGLAPSTQAELAAQAIRSGSSAHELEQAVQQHKRNEEWRKQREVETRREAEAREERTKDGIARLAAKKVAKDAPIYVVDYYGGASDGTRKLVQLLTEAGYTKVVHGKSVTSRSSAKDCDCTAWKVAPQWDGKVTVSPACVKPAHQKAKTEAEETERRDRWALREKVRGEAKAAFPGLVAQLAGAPRLLLEAIAWELMDYRLPDWAAAHGGKRGNPWPTLRAASDEVLLEAISKALGEGFDDHYHSKVDWDEVHAVVTTEAPAT